MSTITNKVGEKSRECHTHNHRPFLYTMRKRKRILILKSILIGNSLVNLNIFNSFVFGCDMYTVHTVKPICQNVLDEVHVYFACTLLIYCTNA